MTGPEELLLAPLDPLPEDAQAASKTAAAQAPTDLLSRGYFMLVLLNPVRAPPGGGRLKRGGPPRLA